MYVQAPSAGSVYSITRFFDRTERRMIVPFSLRSFINRKRLFDIDSDVGMKGRGRYLPRSLCQKHRKVFRRSGDFRRPLSALGLTLLSIYFSISYRDRERRMPKAQKGSGKCPLVCGAFFRGCACCLRTVVKLFHSKNGGGGLSDLSALSALGHNTQNLSRLQRRKVFHAAERSLSANAAKTRKSPAAASRRAE